MSLHPPALRTERTVRTDDGAELAVSVLEGAIPGAVTLVLAHGWGSGRPMWGDVVPALRDAGHTVVLYDQRGHGGSTMGAEGITIPRLGEDFAAVLAALDVRDAVAVGHSGGGFGVLSYVAEQTKAAVSRLRGLVLLATAAHDQDTPDGEVRMMGNPVFHWALNRGPLGRRMLRHTLGERPTPRAEEINRRMFAETPRKVRSDCFASSRGMDLRAGLAAVPLPAVVLAGEADKVIDPRLGADVAAALPDARYERVPGAGHMLPLETPDLVIRTVLAAARP